MEIRIQLTATWKVPQFFPYSTRQQRLGIRDVGLKRPPKEGALCLSQAHKCARGVHAGKLDSGNRSHTRRPGRQVTEQGGWGHMSRIMKLWVPHLA